MDGYELFASLSETVLGTAAAIIVGIAWPVAFAVMRLGQELSSSTGCCSPGQRGADSRGSAKEYELGRQSEYRVLKLPRPVTPRARPGRR